MKISIFGAWAPFDNDEEKIQAKQYLELWKFFFLKKLKGYGEFIDEEWVLKSFDIHINTLVLKITCNMLVDLDKEIKNEN